MIWFYMGFYKIPSEAMDWQVTNIVAVGKIDVAGKSLQEIYEKLDNALYNPNVFPAIRIFYDYGEGRKVSILLFASRKFVVAGAKNYKEVERTVKDLVKKLKAKLEWLEIVNVVALLDTGRKIDVERASMELENVMYEPSIFPGLVVRLGNGVAGLVFYSGRVVLAGNKSVEDVERNAENVYRMLSRFFYE